MAKVSSSTYINEADVEIKVMYPILTKSGMMNLDPMWVRPKEYLAPTVLDKQAGKKSGYFPDFSVWMQGHPVLVVEVKDTDVAVELGYREALLYARHLNARYPSGRNPCQFVLATNGVELVAGVWDQEEPLLRLRIDDLKPGTTATESLNALTGRAALEKHAAKSTRNCGLSEAFAPSTSQAASLCSQRKRPSIRSQRGFHRSCAATSRQLARRT